MPAKDRDQFLLSLTGCRGHSPLLQSPTLGKDAFAWEYKDKSAGIDCHIVTCEPGDSIFNKIKE
ncbi:MAG: hypothetical protein ACXW1Z_13975 [Methylobacter sp.]